MADNLSFTKLDFGEIREELKNFLRSQNQFQDYNFEGSNISVLLDLLAANSYQQNFYRNMAFSEMFLDTAQLRQNALSHAKEMNYLPASTQSATTRLNLTFNNVTDNPTAITIPKGTKFTAQCGTKSFTFLTDKSHTVTPSGNTYRITGMPVFEGKYVKEFYTVDDNNPVDYVINNENVDISSLTVRVRSTSDVGSTVNDYVRATSIFGVEANDRVFYVDNYFDNLYKIDFGRNRFGRQPVTGNVIELEYRVTKGSEANGAKNYSPVGTIAGYSARVTNNEAAINGSERETLEDIKFFAPKSLQVQDRAVTKTDYEILLKQRFPNIQAISVYGGDELNPPDYGKVYISVDVVGSIGAGDSEIVSYKEYIRDKTPLTVEPVFVPAKFMFVNMVVNVTYDPKLTAMRESEIQSLVRNALVDYSEANLNKFNSTLRQSRVSNVIDQLDDSIVSTDIVAKPIIEYAPSLGISTSPSFDFNASLRQPYLLNENVGFNNYESAISTSRFTINNNLVELQDDGSGSINAVTASDSAQRIFKRRVGIVNYQTGSIKLSNFNVSSYVGSAIQIIANTSDKDITAPKDRILVIRANDLTINVRALGQETSARTASDVSFASSSSSSNTTTTQVETVDVATYPSTGI